MEFVGESSTTLMGSELKENQKIMAGDMFVTTPSNAVNIGGGTQYKRVDGVTDIVAFLADKGAITTISNEDLENEMISRGLLSSDVAEPSTGSGTDGVASTSNAVSDADTEKEAAEKEAEVTLENVMSMDLKQIKTACKKHKITIGQNDKEALISLLLPFLQD